MIAQDIDPRINWVVPYGTLANGDKAFSDRIIIKHPFKELSIDPNQYESHIAAKLSKDHDPKTAVDTIFINGTKSRTDIRNAIDYSMERKGVPHIVAVVTDTTAKLGEIVKHDLLNRATYISNNDELGLLVGESCSKKDDGAYVIKLEDTLHAIRKLRELQRTGNRLNGTDNPYQNIYVTLGQYGSISVDKQGNISWVGSYQAAWISSPDSTGFGDAFAAGIALAENVDRNISPVYAQIFASALVASKLKDPNYRVAKPGDIKRMINYNDIAIVGLGQFDENNNLGNLRQKRISRLDTLFRTSSLVYGR